MIQDALSKIYTPFLEYINGLDISLVPTILRYEATQPLIFSSGLFFALFLCFLVIYRLLKHQTKARILYVTLFSLYFYYKCSGLYLILLVAMVTSDFIIGRCIEKAESKELRKRWVTLSVGIDLGILAFFKYFNFLATIVVNSINSIGTIAGISHTESLSWEGLPIILPVGISFFTFQSLSYIIDVYRGDVKPLNRWIDYLFYVSFFPQLVAGPIVRAKDFIPQIYRTPYLSKGNFGKGLFLVMIGLFKKAIISDYISLNFVDRVFEAPALYSGVENILAAYGYALQIYCDFSGYSDMAIGIALFLGFKFNDNFDVPYNAATITEFWRRWHISLSSWLKDYLYIPLGGNRKGRFRTYLNLLVTMLLGGLWHGAAWQFIFWGGMHGLALAIHKLWMRIFPKSKVWGKEMRPFWRCLGILVTFHYVVFLFLFFRASSFESGMQMIHQMLYAFHPEVFTQFISGYTLVFIFIVLGYILHFLPRHWRRGAQRGLTRSPFLLQVLLFTLLVFFVFQVKSADVQPFIYFQF